MSIGTETETPAAPDMGASSARTLTRPILLAVLVILAIGVALNVTGLIPIPVGPLGDHQPAIADSSRSTLDYVPSRTAVYLSALVENTGPISATVIRVTPVGVSVPGSVTVLGSLPFNSNDRSQSAPTGLPRVLLGVQPDAGPGWTSPDPVAGVSVDPKGSAQYQGRAFLVEITADPTEVTTVLRFDVEYTVGPFHFMTTAWGPVGTTVVMCPRALPNGTADGCAAE